MQPTAARGSNRIERRLDGLRANPALGVPVRFYFRRREQLLYLVVGGWNTVFGYGIWAVLQFLLGNHLHYLVVVLISWPIAVLNAYVGYRYIVFRYLSHKQFSFRGEHRGPTGDASSYDPAAVSKD